MNSTPRITVGAPTYNRADYLEEYLNYVLAQSFNDFEIVICDDCSTDNTEGVVRSFSDSRIRYFRNEQNLNIPGNLNRILDLSRGEFIVMLHDHDRFHEQLLERMASFLDQHQDVAFVHTGNGWIDPDGGNYIDVSPEFDPVTKGEEILHRFLLGKSFSCQINACGMVRRSAYEQVGFYYDPQFGFLADVDMWLRLASEFDVGYIREPLITCRRRDIDHQYSGVNWQLISWIVETHRINIQRLFFGDEKALKGALKNWKSKAGRYCLINLAAAAANGDRDAVDSGFKYLSSLELSTWSGLAHFFENKHGLQHLLADVIKFANISRKWLGRDSSAS